MNEENENVEINEDNQADFEQLFFNGEPVEEESSEESDDTNEEIDESLGEEGEDLDPSATDEEDEEEPEEEEKPKAKKNRNSAQERIKELTAEKHQERREKEALLRRLEELEAVIKKDKVEETPLKEKLPDGAPNYEALDKDGNPIYELGEFDPKFIRDLTKFTIEQEMKEAREQEKQRTQQAAIEEAKSQLQSEWIEKLEKYEEEAPDVRENIEHLTDTFQNLDPAYGEYLATAIMASEVGPQLMHYLSNNIGEAQRIVASGPAAATLALGRLEARFIKSSDEKETKRNTKRVSDAPEPPESISRGSKGQFAVRPDTDDQRAFEREFFKK